jgi:hypothetical protein
MESQKTVTGHRAEHYHRGSAANAHLSAHDKHIGMLCGQGVAGVIMSVRDYNAEQ